MIYIHLWLSKRRWRLSLAASPSFSLRHAQRANIAKDQPLQRSTQPSRNPVPTTGTSSHCPPPPEGRILKTDMDWMIYLCYPLERSC